MNNPIIVLIPSRFGSSRFPGKALASIQGKAMILHVLDKARTVFENVFVATDDHRIVDVVEKAGGKAILTGNHHHNGTERCAEAVEKIVFRTDSEAIVINLQGDEPFIPSELLSQLAESFSNPDIEIATCVHPVSNRDDIMNPSRVKVVMDNSHNAIYFSRSPIPFAKNHDSESDPAWYHHIGIYGFRLNILKKLVLLEPGILEQKESLEQLRWLENGYKIHCLETNYEGFGVDTPDDLKGIIDNYRSKDKSG